MVYSLHPLAFPKSWLLRKRVPRKVNVGKLWGHTFGREVFIENTRVGGWKGVTSPILQCDGFFFGSFCLHVHF